MADFLSYLVSEWAVISQAPVTFIFALFLASGVIWWLVGWAYASRIKSKDAIIAMLKANAKESRAEKREKLEQEVLQLKASRPGISIKPALKAGMDEDDVREEQIKIKERRIIELSDPR